MMKTSRLLLFFIAGMLTLSASGVTLKDNPIPVHRPLIEEYTGTWCGWCIRGIVGMELLSETFGDDFIGVAIHNGDAMTILSTSNYPNNVNSFPNAYVERSYNVDPYYGSGETPAGIVSFMQRLANRQTTAGIDVTAQWADQEKSAIDVHVSNYFTIDDNSGNYAIEVMLIADDLYGSISTWNQSNYYSGLTEYSSDPNLAPWITQPSTIRNYHFNDVLVGTSRVVNGSLPAEIKAYEVNTFDYTFTLSALPKPALIQNKDNLHVIAIVVNKQTKKVINANRCYIDELIIVIPGDVDDDGNVGIGDVTSLIDYILNGDDTVINSANADVDSDGEITIADVTSLIDLILNA